MEQTVCFLVMMKKIAVFGAGGFGREVTCIINQINEEQPTWDFIGYFDDGVAKGTQISHFGEVLGGMDELNSYGEDLCLAIAIGSPKSLRGVRERIINQRICFPNIIHPSIRISDKETFRIGEGNIIQANSSVSCDVTIGNFNVLNGQVGLGHDDQIGNFNVIMPAVRISGEVTIGNENFFGVGSIVLQQIRIGDNIRLGAGSVLMRKPKDGYLYMGNPAKKVEL